MTETNTPPEWPAVGDKVAIYTPGRMGSGSVSMATVERFTTTQVLVCDRGRDRRYRRTDLGEVGDGRSRLLRPTDPNITRVLAAARVSTLRSELDQALRNDAGSGSVGDALNVLTAVAALVADARTFVERLADKED